MNTYSDISKLSINNTICFIQPNQKSKRIMYLSWQICPFQKLSVEELYEAMELRQSVFIVEQKCAFLDADGKDASAWHVFGRGKKGQLIAYSRLLSPENSWEAASIGRVVTHSSVRGMGYGRQLILRSIATAALLFPENPINISAQFHLLEYYRSLGFEPFSEIYYEDGIAHISMQLKRYSWDISSIING